MYGVKNVIIITNNPRVCTEFPHLKHICVQGGQMDVLCAVRDLVHKGYTLLTHPLSGSVKPNETPYKSILVGQMHCAEADQEDVKRIESGIETVRKFPSVPLWDASTLEDCMVVDLDLIQGAVANLG